MLKLGQKTMQGRCQSQMKEKYHKSTGADVKAEWISKLGGRQCWADLKESWADVKAGWKKQLGRRQSWADVKAGKKTMLGRCQRKLGGCQS
jgi:hypothetical protein